MNEESLRELTIKFRQSFAEKKTALDQLIKGLSEATEHNAPLEEIRDHCHYLKGAFGIYGFHDLYEQCEQIQNLIESGIADDKEGLNALKDELNRLIETLESHAL